MEKEEIVQHMWAATQAARDALNTILQRQNALRQETASTLSEGEKGKLLIARHDVCKVFYPFDSTFYTMAVSGRISSLEQLPQLLIDYRLQLERQVATGRGNDDQKKAEFSDIALVANCFTEALGIGPQATALYAAKLAQGGTTGKPRS